MSRGPGRTGGRWRALCRQVYAEETNCIRCRRWVDQSLPPRTPASRSVDHIIPLDAGGAALARDNVGLAHHGCNSRHGALHRWSKTRTHTLTVDVDPSTL